VDLGPQVAEQGKQGNITELRNPNLQSRQLAQVKATRFIFGSQEMLSKHWSNSSYDPVKHTKAKDPANDPTLGLALLSVVIALAFALFQASHDLQGMEFPLFLFAIVLTAWYEGTGPAIFALALFSLAFDYYFTAPLHSFGVERAEISIMWCTCCLGRLSLGLVRSVGARNLIFFGPAMNSRPRTKNWRRLPIRFLMTCVHRCGTWLDLGSCFRRM
jgi:K+-sensing histidine kinase KdpD